jgi:phosphopentomutase
MEGVDAIINFLDQEDRGLIFANLVDFDSLYGHRNNPQGYAEALEAFDQCLPQICDRMRADDVLFITADHGNDPTTPGTDHTRERVPLLVYGLPIKAGENLGTRASFSDLAATTADLLDIPWNGPGKSMGPLLVQ